MKRILLIGHIDSGLEWIVRLLSESGIRKAARSRREQMDASEIIHSISNEMNVPALKRDSAYTSIGQVRPGPVWDNLILDLIIGNNDQEACYWADSQALPFLEYLAELDEQLGFVFLYHEPFTSLAPKTIQEKYASECAANLSQQLDNWVRYNSEMLKFFLRNQDRCLLAHTGSALKENGPFLDLLSEKLGLASIPPQPGCPDVPKTSTSRAHASELCATIVEQVQQILPKGELPPFATSNHLAAQDVESLIVGNVLNQYPAAQQLFEQLNASADIAAYNPAEMTAFDAWTGLQTMRCATFQLLEAMTLHCQKLNAGMQNLASEKELAANQSALLSEKVATLQKSMESLERQSSKLKTERDLFARQLSNIQYELERLYLENREDFHSEEELPGPTGAAERIKGQLSYKLGSLMVQRSKSVSGLISLPLAMIREAKMFSIEIANKEAPKLPPIDTYADKHLANQIKNQLTYRLGHIVVTRSRSISGWLLMPFVIIDCTLRFHQDQRSSRKS